MDIQTTVDSLEVWESADRKIRFLEGQISRLEAANGELELEVAKLRAELEQLKAQDVSDAFIQSLTAGYERK